LTPSAFPPSIYNVIATLLRTPGAALRYLVEQDAFAVVDPLTPSAFVTFCKERKIDVDLEKLEKLERLRVFYPLARVEYPRIEVKIERVGVDRVRFHGMLKDGESWDGELREENSRFSWRRDWAASWLAEGALWDPRERPFEAWETFRRKDNSWEPRVQSFYSPFQAFVLRAFLKWITMRVPADVIVDWSPAEMETFGKTLADWSAKVIDGARSGHRSDEAAFLAQVISNRYYFHTRGDRRTIRVSEEPFEEWDWHAFTRSWKAKEVAEELGLTADEIADIHGDVSFLTTSADPLERWYELVSFVSVDKRDQLKDQAKFAQLGYSIERMLRMFYRDVTGRELRPPHERHAGVHLDEEEAESPESLMKELEYVVNEFNLNPKPKLILVVEGDGEAAELPRLSRDLLGYDFAQLAIEVRNLRGIPNFTGTKGRDPYSALEKFIDDHHYRQTIVFCVLDREGRAQRTKERLVAADSQFVPWRKLTCDEYIHLWNDSIEFDNFSDDEIAAAMTRVSEERYTFTDAEVAAARAAKAQSGNPLNTLYHRALSYDLNKVRLLRELFNAMIANAVEEHARNPPRPIVKLLYRMIELAVDNYQPVSEDLWRRNQETGYFGPLKNTAEGNEKADG
jgi:hypothetical protein